MVLNLARTTVKRHDITREAKELQYELTVIEKKQIIDQLRREEAEKEVSYGTEG